MTPDNGHGLSKPEFTPRTESAGTLAMTYSGLNADAVSINDGAKVREEIDLLRKQIKEATGAGDVDVLLIAVPAGRLEDMARAINHLMGQGLILPG